MSDWDIPASAPGPRPVEANTSVDTPESTPVFPEEKDAEMKPTTVTGPIEAGWDFGALDSAVNEVLQQHTKSGETNSCYTCGEVGHRKADCPQGRPSRACFNCGEEGHNKSDCPNPPKPREFGGTCYNCGEEGHSKADCPTSPKPREFSGTCYNCGEEGHSKADCPNPPKPREFGGTCYNCGEEGHSKADCHNPSKPNGLCRNCGEEGHMRADCPQPKVFTGKCFNCGEEGHSKTECTNPKVFTGTCRVCNQEGHHGSECPNRICDNCGKEGHSARQCTSPRKLQAPKTMDTPEEISQASADQSWARMAKADEEGDLEDFRRGLLAYAEACECVTLADIELGMRSQGFRIHLIALETPLLGNKTIVNLQGVPEQKYSVKFQFGPKPKRAILTAEIYPASPEENLERLKHAGFVMDSYTEYCINCQTKGHHSKNCPEEPRVRPEKRDEGAITGRCAMKMGPERVWGKAPPEPEAVEDSPEDMQAMQGGSADWQDDTTQGESGFVGPEASYPRASNYGNRGQATSGYGGQGNAHQQESSRPEALGWGTQESSRPSGWGEQESSTQRASCWGGQESSPQGASDWGVQEPSRQGASGWGGQESSRQGTSRFGGTEPSNRGFSAHGDSQPKFEGSSRYRRQPSGFGYQDQRGRETYENRGGTSFQIRSGNVYTNDPREGSSRSNGFGGNMDGQFDSGTDWQQPSSNDNSGYDIDHAGGRWE